MSFTIMTLTLNPDPLRELYLLKMLQPLRQVDGAFGPKSAAAVSAFQQQAGLPVTGTADTDTRRALLARVLA
jgi:peptidoglycan hydrolase-like protein with peptidoglycan-binding domain